jgi:energy-coupling factor transport system permease protein
MADNRRFTPRAERGQDAFGAFHPALCFGFFVAALVLGMCLRHPVYQAIGLGCALLYYFVLRGKAGLRLLKWMVPLCVLVTLINPLFDSLGETVLFTWAGGRPYTFEALCAGTSAGLMVATVLLWFGCYNAVVTSDKFLYLFGRIIPSASLVLTMALRLVPRLQTKMRDIRAALAGVGHFDAAAASGRFRQSTRVLEALSGWALERSVVTADSMRARGLGLTGRTSFARYRFTQRDAVLLGLFAVLAATIVVVLADGTAQVSFVPALVLPPVGPASVMGYAAYTVLLLVPSAIDIGEALLWRSSLSRI